MERCLVSTNEISFDFFPFRFLNRKKALQPKITKQLNKRNSFIDRPFTKTLETNNFRFSYLFAVGLALAPTRRTATTTTKTENKQVEQMPETPLRAKWLLRRRHTALSLSIPLGRVFTHAPTIPTNAEKQIKWDKLLSINSDFRPTVCCLYTTCWAWAKSFSVCVRVYIVQAQFHPFFRSHPNHNESIAQFAGLFIRN